MKIILYSLVSLSLAGLAGCGGGYTSPAVAGTTITIAASAPTLGAAAYGTNPLHLPLNSTVAWHNADTVNHTATTTSAPISFNSGTIGPGGTSGVITLTMIGTYSYQCLFHGAAMTGTIIVP